MCNIVISVSCLLLTPLCVLTGWGPSLHSGRISVYHAAGLSTFPLRPTCFPRYFLNLCYDGAYALRPHSRLWSGFDAVSSGLPPPFLSLCRSSLVCLCCHCGCSLFYSFGFLHSLLPPSRHYASARPHVNRHRSPALHPVFQQLVPTASVYFYTPLSLVVPRYAPLVVFAEGVGFEPTSHF